MAVNLSPVGGVAAQFFDNSGNVLTGGKLYTYLAGTTTPQPAYTTSAGNIAWSNPIILDAAGRVSGSGEIWLTDGIQYKFILRDSNDVLIATYDNVIGINSNFVNFTNQQEIQTATAGQTVFNLTTMQYQPGTNSLSVFVDGVNQYGPGAQYAYVETDADTITFVNGLHVGAEVKFTTSQLNTSGSVDASQVSYTAPFTNAVATNVEAKLSETVSVKDFGAVGDGVVDDTAAINNALSANQNGIVFIPPGTYRVTNTINIPAYTTLQGLSSGSSATAGTGGALILADLSVSPIVSMNGGGQSASVNLVSVNVSRATGSIPAGSIGVRLDSTDEAILQDVIVSRSAVGFEVLGQLSITFDKCNTFAITDTHVLLDDAFEVNFTNCRFGRNGGVDFNCNQFVKITGGGDTYKFIGCQFNQSGNSLIRGIFLESYSSPNGILYISASHVENISGAFVASSDASTFQRIGIDTTTINLSPTTPLFSGAANLFAELSISNCQSIDASLTLDNVAKFNVTGNKINGAIVINTGAGVFLGNVLNSSLLVQGTMTESVIVSNNTLVAGQPITNTASGLVAVFNNLTGTVATNNALTNSVSGNYLKLGAQVPFTVERYVGSCDSSGNVFISFTNSQVYVLTAQGFYKGNSGEAKLLTFSYADGTGIAFTGGTNAAKYRITVIYSSTIDSNW